MLVQVDSCQNEREDADDGRVDYKHKSHHMTPTHTHGMLRVERTHFLFAREFNVAALTHTYRHLGGGVYSVGQLCW